MSIVNVILIYRKTSNRGRVPNTSRVHLVVYQLTAYDASVDDSDID